MTPKYLIIDGKTYAVSHLRLRFAGWYEVVIMDESNRPIAAHLLPADFCNSRVRQTLFVTGHTYKWAHDDAAGNREEPSID